MRRRCGKARYGNEQHALIALAHVQAKREWADTDGPRECRVYECRRCRGWHLTSKPLNEEKAA